MLHRIVISLLICLQTVYAYSQDSLCYTTKWHISTSFGASTTLQPYFKGEVTDPLVGFDDHTFDYQLLSLTYFLKKHWGVALNVRFGYTHNKKSAKINQFNQLMQAQYENNYYINDRSGDPFNIGLTFDDYFTDVNFSLVYRQEWSRFFIYPKLSIGSTSFSCAWGQATLKQKNSNEIFDVFFEHNNPKDFFTIGTSALAGYKLSKKFFLHLEPLVEFYRTRFNFTKTTTNLNSGEKTIENTYYNRNVFRVSLSAGLTYVIK